MDFVRDKLLNFVKNAVKFTSSGYINVRLSKVDNNLLFEVIDTGIGVPEEKKQLIFKEFCQADASTTRKFGGTGLGLSISSHIIKAHNGKLFTTKRPDGNSGAVFIIELPAVCGI